MQKETEIETILTRKDYFSTSSHQTPSQNIPIEAIVSEEMAERLTWGRFVNWHGGEGKNIANDAAQEICNDSSKDVVKGMGANKTTKAILRASQSGAGVHEIKWSFDKATNIPVSYTHLTLPTKLEV